MDRKIERSKANVGILASGTVLLIIIFCHMLGSDLAKQPGPLRNVRLVLDILLENHMNTWENWYADNFVAKLLVWLVTAIPVVILLVSVGAKFGWSFGLPTFWRNLIDVDAPEEEEAPRTEGVRQEEYQAQAEPILEKNRQQAMERLEVLHTLCKHTPPIMNEPCVRVQMLSGNPNQRIDRILEWFGTPESYYASVHINPQYEILLTLDDKGRPAIVGLTDESEDGEPYWVEELYPLDPDGVSTVLMRPSGQGTVNRYAITWLGGNNV